MKQKRLIKTYIGKPYDLIVIWTLLLCRSLPPKIVPVIIGPIAWQDLIVQLLLILVNIVQITVQLV